MSKVKDFFVKQALKLGTKNMPKEQQEMMIKLMEKKPELFEQIAKDIKASTDKGTPEMYAAFEVMKKYEKQLQAAVMDSGMSAEDIQKLAKLAVAE